MQPGDCQSLAEVRAFYRRAGQLVALAYFFNATDLQYENLIAAGSDPILIDLETFFAPQVRSLVPGQRDQTRDGSDRSVLDTGLLTFWVNSQSHPDHDFSGLSGSGGHVHIGQRLRWVHLNSDEMRPECEPVISKLGQNQVFLNGTDQHPHEFTREIIAGFSELFRFVLARKQSFIEFLSRFSDARSRLLFRPSQVYALLIKRSTVPENFVSGVRRSISLDQLYRPPIKGGYLSEELARIIEAEISAMLNLDVPPVLCSVE